MKVIKTASTVLDISEEEFSILRTTLQHYTNAFNFCSNIGFENNCSNGINLHKLTYYKMRELFNLPSQLAISVRTKAIASLKPLLAKVRKNKNPEKKFRAPFSKLNSILLYQNSHTLWLHKAKISILTCNGRLKLNLKTNPFFNSFSEELGWKHTSATLSFKKNKFFLNVQFEKDIADIPRNQKFLGIDRGIKKIAVTSTNKFYGGGKVRKAQKRYLDLRKRLQEKGTKSAKRHLRRISGEEKRFKADVNHCITKEIVSALKPGDTIVLEDLSGIRNARTRKKIRTQVSSWNYFQFEQFLTYKANERCINIEYVDARYTSQRCSKCGFICRSNRKSQSGFECKECGFKLNADLNAARNIVLKHLDTRGFQVESGGYPERGGVNHPNVSGLTWHKVKLISGTSPCL
jgi:IS605 OrfB family transposase